jgi:hypothetical protein
MVVPTNSSKWRMGFNSAFKGLTKQLVTQTAQPSLIVSKSPKEELYIKADEETSYEHLF